jgi:hypothetical protein
VYWLLFFVALLVFAAIGFGLSALSRTTGHLVNRIQAVIEPGAERSLPIACGAQCSTPFKPSIARFE